MNRFATIRRRLVYTLVCLSLAAGCGRSPDSTSPPGLVDAPRNSEGAGFAEVTCKANVHIVEQAEGAHALISVNTDGSTLVFNRKLGSISAMADGDDILIKGLLARKVAASQTDGD